MIKFSRRQVLLGAVCAGLTAIPVAAAWTTARPAFTAVAPAAAAQPAGSAGTPAGALAGTSASASPTSSAATPALPPPVGWKLTDVPRFPPAPAPEPITLLADGRAAALSRVPVTQPVAFLTIDDGYLKNPEAVKLLAAANIPVTLFLTTDAIHDDVPFFARLREHGAVIEAHTIDHPQMRGRPYAFQKHQICESADRLGTWYGRRPVLFRPPYGEKDDTTLRAAHDCGMKAVFTWKETVDKGKVRYQDEHRVQPGDVILMHFRPAFVQDFLGALRAIHRAGLTPALLEDYVPA